MHFNFRGPTWKGETGLLFSTPDKSAAFFSQAAEPILRETRKYMVRRVEPSLRWLLTSTPDRLHPLFHGPKN